jgi:hypothetical protein
MRGKAGLGQAVSLLIAASNVLELQIRPSAQFVWRPNPVTMMSEEIWRMQIVIQVHRRDCAKAWGLLVRHSPGVALPKRTFVVSVEAARALRKAGIRFKQVSREGASRGALAGERI